jgi:hypothetical protein
MDLSLFARQVERIRPGVRVIIPEMFVDIDFNIRFNTDLH